MSSIFAYFHNFLIYNKGQDLLSQLPSQVASDPADVDATETCDREIVLLSGISGRTHDCELGMRTYIRHERTIDDMIIKSSLVS